MRVGIHKRLWVKNVAAIGLSAGFIEPLESNGLFTVHEFLLELIRNLQREKVSQWDRDNFSYTCRQIFNNFAEFVASHYALSHRDETEYWKHMMNKEWSSDLTNRINPITVGFVKNVIKRNFDYEHDNNDSGFHSIAAGMNWAPTDLNTIIRKSYNNNLTHWISYFNEVTKHLENKKKMWKSSVKKVPTLYDFLQSNYYK